MILVVLERSEGQKPSSHGVCRVTDCAQHRAPKDLSATLRFCIWKRDSNEWSVGHVGALISFQFSL